jgi:hypothetical protein
VKVALFGVVGRVFGIDYAHVHIDSGSECVETDACDILVSPLLICYTSTNLDVALE